jgi:DNA-binding IclR family transcriptional regulator
MSLDRDLQAAVEAVNELWSDAERNAEDYRRFAAEVRRSRLTDVLLSLRDELGGSMYLAVYEEGEVRVLVEASGPVAPRLPEWVDFRSGAHALSFGKALLAQLGEDELRDHIARHPLARLTSRTTTSEKVLRRKLRELPAPGPPSPFLDLQEYSIGWVSAAIPVSGTDRPTALAVYFPLVAAHRLRAGGDRLAEAAVELRSVVESPVTADLLRPRMPAVPAETPPLTSRAPAAGAAPRAGVGPRGTN